MNKITRIEQVDKKTKSITIYGFLWYLIVKLSKDIGLTIMTDVKIPPTNGDRIIGGILTVIGILGILRAIQVAYSLHTSRPGYTIGLMMGGILINSLIPLVFVSSGYYYLSGGNAKRIAKKKQIKNTQPVIQSTSPVTSPGTNAQAPSTFAPNPPSSSQPPQDSNYTQPNKP